MINGIVSVLVIFTIFFVGFIFTLKKIWPASSTIVFSTTVVKLAAPALALISISDRFTPELLRFSFFYLLIISFYTLLLFITGKILSHFLRLKTGKKDIFEVTFTFSNTIFIGLPINEIVFGDSGLPYLFIFYLVTLIGFWSLGAYKIAKVSTDPSLKGSGLSGFLKKMLSPGLICVIIGCILVEFNIDIPTVLDTALRYVSSLCVPLSLLVIGANLTAFAKGIPKITSDEVWIIVGKFVISPLYMFVLLKLFNVDGIAFQVFMLTATMPCHMQTSILAEHYNVEKEYASKLVGITTLICLFTIPVFVSLLV